MRSSPKFISKKAVVILGMIWFVGFTLLTLAITDLFTESFFQARYLPIYLLMFGPAAVATVLVYWRVKYKIFH